MRGIYWLAEQLLVIQEGPYSIEIVNREEMQIASHNCVDISLLLAAFYIHGSVHRNSMLIRSNKMQQYAGFYLLQNHSTCFGRLSHPSSGVHKTVTAASGTGHSNRATTFRLRGLIRPRRRKVVVLLIWPVPEAAVTALCTPDDGCDRRPKHVEWFCSK